MSLSCLRSSILSTFNDYDGLVLTTIDVKEDPDEPGRVTFDAKSEGRKDDDDALFIRNLRVIKMRDGDPVEYEAEKASLSEAQEIMNKSSLDENERSLESPDQRKALFVIHGFGVRMWKCLERCRNATPQFKKFYVIPVIWPSKANPSASDYKEDQLLSKAAGEALRTVISPMKEIQCSLMCHSMGNRVLRFLAAAEYTNDPIFDNIFMMAADTDRDIFHKKFIERQSDDGLQIKNLVNDNGGGKIHVIYSRSDYALQTSAMLNNQKRLGQYGVNFGDQWFIRDEIHPDLKPFIKNINATVHTEHGRLDEGSGALGHDYHFSGPSIKYVDKQYM